MSNKLTRPTHSDKTYHQPAMSFRVDPFVNLLAKNWVNPDKIDILLMNPWILLRMKFGGTVLRCLFFYCFQFYTHNIEEWIKVVSCHCDVVLPVDAHDWFWMLFLLYVVRLLNISKCSHRKELTRVWELHFGLLFSISHSINAKNQKKGFSSRRSTHILFFWSWDWSLVQPTLNFKETINTLIMSEEERLTAVKEKVRNVDEWDASTINPICCTMLRNFENLWKSLM